MNEKRDEIKDRIYLALALNDMKPIELSEKTGISKSTISQYMSGYSKPKQDRIYLLAKALNVSEAWLLGYDVSSERKEPVPEYDPQIQEVTDLFCRLNQEQKQTVLNMLRSFVV